MHELFSSRSFSSRHVTGGSYRAGDDETAPRLTSRSDGNDTPLSPTGDMARRLRFDNLYNFNVD